MKSNSLMPTVFGLFVSAQVSAAELTLLAPIAIELEGDLLAPETARMALRAGVPLGTLSTRKSSKRRMLGVCCEIVPGKDQESAWTDLDFEEVHYDHAHLGIGTIGRRCWRMDIFGKSSGPVWQKDPSPLPRQSR